MTENLKLFKLYVHLLLKLVGQFYNPAITMERTSVNISSVITLNFTKKNKVGEGGTRQIS